MSGMNAAGIANEGVAMTYSDRGVLDVFEKKMGIAPNGDLEATVAGTDATLKCETTGNPKENAL